MTGVKLARVEAFKLAEKISLAALAELRKGIWCATQAKSSEDESIRDSTKHDAIHAYENALRLLMHDPSAIRDANVQDKLIQLERLLCAINPRTRRGSLRSKELAERRSCMAKTGESLESPLPHDWE